MLRKLLKSLLRRPPDRLIWVAVGAGLGGAVGGILGFWIMYGDKSAAAPGEFIWGVNGGMFGGLIGGLCGWAAVLIWELLLSRKSPPRSEPSRD